MSGLGAQYETDCEAFKGGVHIIMCGFDGVCGLIRMCVYLSEFPIAQVIHTLVLSITITSTDSLLRECQIIFQCKPSFEFLRKVKQEKHGYHYCWMYVIYISFYLKSSTL